MKKLDIINITKQNGSYETKTFRYVEFEGKVIRIRKAYLNTTGALMPTQSSESKWELFE